MQAGDKGARGVRTGIGTKQGGRRAMLYYGAPLAFLALGLIWIVF